MPVLDRPDIQFTAKEISRAMASPTVHADGTLKALSLYLAGHPRVLWRYHRQEWTEKVWGLTDSNSAACPETRKSSSATYFMLGKHPVFTASSTQTILSLSSGEAVRSCAVCLSNAGVEESHVGLVTGGQGRAFNGQLSMQRVVFQTWCGENSTHPLSCTVASTRRGTTTDCDYPACDCWTCLDWPRAKVERSKR